MELQPFSQALKQIENDQSYKKASEKHQQVLCI